MQPVDQVAETPSPPPAKPRSSGAGRPVTPVTPKSPKKKVKMKGGVKVTIEAFDKDGNAQIDQAEYLASGGTEEEFGTLDADGSGKIDASELKQTAAAAEAALESPDAPTTPLAAIMSDEECAWVDPLSATDRQGTDLMAAKAAERGGSELGALGTSKSREGKGICRVCGLPVLSGQKRVKADEGESYYGCLSTSVLLYASDFSCRWFAAKIVLLLLLLHLRCLVLLFCRVFA